MKIFFVIMVLSAASSWVRAAIPTNYSDCLRLDSSSSLSFRDLKDLAAVSRVTFCQNQVGVINKNEVKELLKSNVELAVSLARTNYVKEDLLDLAKTGSFLLYVDSGRLAKEALIDLANAGVQLVVMSSTSNLSREDLLALARAKPFILNLNSVARKEDLRALLELKVQVAIRSSQSSLSKDDIVEIARGNSDLVTIFP